MANERSAEEAAPVIAVVDAFHDALRRGDEMAVLHLLALDAMVLENGVAQTRAEYERDHLKDDIAFAREVASTRSLFTVRSEGETAWVISKSRTRGFFRSRRINSIGTELMVLTKSLEGWRIRAIHWSSHQGKEK